jgi:hypothetical protein
LLKIDKGTIVENKQLGAVLAYCAERQNELEGLHSEKIASSARKEKPPRRREKSKRQLLKLPS